MYLKELEINGFKSFAKKTSLTFDTPVTAIVGPNGSGKSNVAEALRWVLGEQSMKSLRGKKGEDLIFSGSKGTSRLSKASVSIVFDNSKKVFNVDFDEVAIKREVHRDGSNQYYINGSQVRLKDVYELLSQVSLGASSHHIISQGEADRVLSANSKERRGMIEDALGLKIYQYKKAESERKLEKTKENIKEAESLRRELAPQLRYLKKQVEQVERVEEMKSELESIYTNYFSVEEALIRNGIASTSKEVEELRNELHEINSKLESAQSKISESDRGEREEAKLLRDAEQSIREVSLKKDEEARKLGRIEGMIEVIGNDDEADYIVKTKEGDKRCRYCGQGISESHSHLNPDAVRESKRNELENEKRVIEDSLESLSLKESELMTRREELQQLIEGNMSEIRQLERGLFDLKTEKNQLENRLVRAKENLERFENREARFKNEQGQAGIILGKRVEFEKFSGDTNTSDIKVGQEEALKKIDRIKIRIEDSGGGGSEILEEYKETQERDEHIASEIADLEKSAESLNILMDDLSKTLENKFENGLTKINLEFNKFFGLLFGGGEAKLNIVKDTKRKTEVEAMLDDKEKEEEDYGIEISVNLPRKKIRGLDMLSGGERALTSIALLFAMSRVNPPPFLVLDETDAALDEANSRKYGDMVETLAKQSQLILITHNRETMSRANVLYGVTMSSDSISKLLSIKFDEATEFAK